MAGGTVTVSAAGSVTAVSIANSGSGYRAGIQTVVNVGVQTDGEPSLHFIGTQQLVVVTSLVLPSLTQELVTLELICQK